MKTHRKLLTATGLSVVLVLVLAGCWSDSDDDPASMPASTEVPDSAGISTAAFVSYLLGLSASDESSEPLTINDRFTVPADDTNEPTPLT